jgi:hypothetical protein
MAQIRNAFAQDQLYGAPGNNDIVLILPHAAIEQWRSSVGTNGCCVSDEIDRGYFYRINGIDIWTPKLTTTSFLQGTYPVKQNDGSTANITGVVAYAVIKSGLEFTYLNAFSDFAKQAGYLSDAYYSGLNSEYTPLVRVTGGRKLVQNLDMPGFVLAAQTSFGIMRNRPNVVVRILLPTNILDYTAAAIVPPAPAPLSSIPASPISPTSRSTRAKTIANKITEDVTTASENIATDNTIAE